MSDGALGTVATRTFKLTSGQSLTVPIENAAKAAQRLDAMGVGWSLDGAVPDLDKSAPPPAKPSPAKVSATDLPKSAAPPAPAPAPKRQGVEVRISDPDTGKPIKIGPETSKTEARLRGAADTASFGGAPKMAGVGSGVRGLQERLGINIPFTNPVPELRERAAGRGTSAPTLSPNETMALSTEEGIKRYRAADEQAKTDRPDEFLQGQVGGVALTAAAPLGEAARGVEGAKGAYHGLRVLANLGKTAAISTGIGGAAGLMNSRAAEAGDIGGTVKDTALGAGTAAVVGPVIAETAPLLLRTSEADRALVAAAAKPVKAIGKGAGNALLALSERAGRGADAARTSAIGTGSNAGKFRILARQHGGSESVQELGRKMDELGYTNTTVPQRAADIEQRALAGKDELGAHIGQLEDAAAEQGARGKHNAVLADIQQLYEQAQGEPRSIGTPRMKVYADELERLGATPPKNGELTPRELHDLKKKYEAAGGYVPDDVRATPEGQTKIANQDIADAVRSRLYETMRQASPDIAQAHSNAMRQYGDSAVIHNLARDQAARHAARSMTAIPRMVANAAGLAMAPLGYAHGGAVGAAEAGAAGMFAANKAERMLHEYGPDAAANMLRLAQRGLAAPGRALAPERAAQLAAERAPRQVGPQLPVQTLRAEIPPVAPLQRGMAGRFQKRPGTPLSIDVMAPIEEPPLGTAPMSSPQPGGADALRMLGQRGLQTVAREGSEGLTLATTRAANDQSRPQPGAGAVASATSGTQAAMQQSRGHELEQKLRQIAETDPSSLGPYGAELASAAQTGNSDALRAVIFKLQQDPTFRTTYLPQIEAMR